MNVCVQQNGHTSIFDLSKYHAQKINTNLKLQKDTRQKIFQ